VESDVLKVRWPHVLLLILFLGGGAFVRCYRLGEQGLWLDEYWAVYEATGLGQPGTSVFHKPTGVVLDPPPAVGFGEAAPVWKIWGGLDNNVHPPLHFILLRLWVDCFGSSDVALRFPSILFDLGTALLLFRIIRRRHGPWPGLIATGLVMFSLAQIDLSREVRSYTLELFLAVLGLGILDRIDRDGATTWRVIALAATAAAMELTHYFAAGYIAGLGTYAVLQFQGRKRRAVVLALVGAAVFVTVVWAPFFWASRNIWQNDSDYPMRGTTAQIVSAFIALPARTMVSPAHVAWNVTFPLALLVYLFPMWRRDPQTALWWFWTMAGVAFVVLLDLKRQTLMTGIYKFTLPASAGFFSLFAIQPQVEGAEGRWRAPLLVILGTGTILLVVQIVMGSFVLPVSEAALILLPALLCLFVIRGKNSWLPWTLVAVFVTAALSFLLRAEMNSTPLLLLWSAPALYVALWVTSPRGLSCWWLPRVAQWTVVVGCILLACRWVAAGSTIIDKGDWHGTAAGIDRVVGANDLIAFTAGHEEAAPLAYIVYRHYSPDSARPVIFLGKGAAELSSGDIRNRKIWMFGLDPDGQTREYFPGWRHGDPVSLPGDNEIWEIFPAGYLPGATR
jgi:4-amino-4-deoxy-L-arabinose transferase-like glycosyltransferase